MRPEQLSFEQAAPVSAPAPSPHPPTPEQAAAIDRRDRDVFLEAGAGTGKTRVLVGRYCDAVDLDGSEPARILAFTFTEKAAAEMRRRVRVELTRRAAAADDGERRMRLRAAARAGESAPITTIHGFCRRLLASHPIGAGLDPRFRVLDADESSRLAGIAFETALAELAGSDAAVARLAAGYPRRLFGLIAGAHGDLRSRGELSPELPPIQIAAFDARKNDQEPPDPAELELAAASYEALRRLLTGFGEAYERVKAERSGVDFDDLQLLALRLLGRAPIARAFRERYDHVLVDEFQDTSPIQVDLVRAIVGPATRLFTVGDAFQSIYAFRGADLASFERERDRFAAAPEGEAEVLELSGSFRSRPEVVAAVNAVGAALLDEFRPLRVGRLPEGPAPGPEGPAVELLLTRAERGGWDGEGIEIHSAAAETPITRVAEARALALRLRRLADEGVDPGSMVVLIRAFTHIDAYAEALELAGLDPYVVGGRGYWSAQQVEDALHLLSCVANPLEDQSLLSALASPACGASADALWILRRSAGGGHLWPALCKHLGLVERREPDPGAEAPNEEESERERERAGWAQRLGEGDRERIAGFGRRLIELRRGSGLLPLDSLVERALETFGYDLAALLMEDGRRRAANLRKLVRIAGEYEAHEGRDLRAFLAYARARAQLSDREAEAAVAAEEHAGVRVMTVHAAKGLEFGTVAVADLGRSLSGGFRPDLQLDFGETDEEGPSPPRVGLRLARAGGSSLSVAGFAEIQDAACAADARESCRLAYVAASRARERLILSGCFAAKDLEAQEQPRHSRSALADLLPALGSEGIDGELLEVPAPEPREGLEADFEPAAIAVRVTEPGAETCERLSYDLREDRGAGPEPAPAQPPLLALAERGAGAARNLSYAALADYRRCGYRFLIERVLGLEFGSEASIPLGDGPEPARASEREWDEEPPGPAEAGEDSEPVETVGGRGGAAFARGAGARYGFGRSVHELLEWSARNGWRSPGDGEIETALRRHGIEPSRAARARSLVSGWLTSPLLAELRDEGAELRPEAPFRLSLLGGTVVRGTIDLLATPSGGGPATIVDYKTDALAREAPGALPPAYRLQRALYGLAVAEATGAERVRSAYVFLERAERPLTAELDRAALTAGREEIEALIAGIRGRRFEVTDDPHYSLCNDCPARPRLCSHPRERTMGPPTAERAA